MKQIIGGLIILTTIISCKEKNSQHVYEDLVKRELASGRKVDSIFWGIHLGMVRKDFYLHCWDMNKKGLFNDGQANEYVLYKLNKELKHPASMNFYPDFRDSVISRMRVHIQYDGWAPWNKHLGADSLLPDVLNMFRKWYPAGNPFMELQDAKKRIEYVKVDGNRQITISKMDDVIVNILFDDLNNKNLLDKKE